MISAIASGIAHPLRPMLGRTIAIGLLAPTAILIPLALAVALVTARD